MLNKELRQKLHDYIKMNYDGDNTEVVMYNLLLELQDILWSVEQEIQKENNW